MAKAAAHSRQARDAELRKYIKDVNAEIRKESKSDTLIVGTGTEILESPTEWISTGSLALDRIIRGFNPGGIPLGPRYGRIIHIAGDPSTGKSLLLDHLFLGVQKKGGLCCCSETEATRDPHFARSIGLDLDLVTILQGAQTIEEVLDQGLKWHEKIRKRVGPTVPLLWGLDSLDSIEASKSSAHGISESKGWAYGGGKSEALGVGLKRINARICSQYPTSIVLLNQVRISPQSFSFVTNKYTPGGMAPHFYSSVEIILSGSKLGWRRSKNRTLKLNDLQRKRFGLGKTIKGPIIGRFVQAKITKTKVSDTPFEQTDFYIDLLRGVSQGQGLIGRLIAEGTCELLGGGRIVHHTPDKDYEFPSEAEHKTWLAAHPSVLRFPGPNLRHALEKRAARVPVDADEEEGEAEGGPDDADE